MNVQGKIVSVNPDTGEEHEGIPGLEEAGVAFDPTTQHLDLSKDEKRRTTALMLAIQGYKELIIKDCTSAKLAEEVKRETQGVIFQDFLIDYHGAMSRQMASGVAVHKQYAADFERLGIVCQRRGSRFARASDDVDGRTGILRDMLWSDPQSDDDDTPAFRYVPEACPSFERQMRVYRKKTVVQGGEKIILNEPNVRGIHMPVIAEYAAAARLRYVRPPVSERRTGEVYDRIHKANQKQKRKKSVVRLS